MEHRQLPRPLPSEGRGHRFESCRARQSNQGLTQTGLSGRESQTHHKLTNKRQGLARDRRPLRLRGGRQRGNGSCQPTSRRAREKSGVQDAGPHIAYAVWMTLYFATGDAPRERRRGTRPGPTATGCGFRPPSSHYADLAKLAMRSVIADNKARTYQGGVTFSASPLRTWPARE